MQEEAAGTSALSVISRRWWVIALTTVVAVAAAAIGLSLITPTYRATATLEAPIATGAQTPTDLSYVDRLMNTYSKLAQQPDVVATVSREVRAPASGALSATVDPNTELLDLSAASRSAVVAQRMANVAAAVLIDRANSIAHVSALADESQISSQIDALSTALIALKVQRTQLAPRERIKRVTLDQQISGNETNYNALIQQRAQLQLADSARQQTLSVVQPAALPTSPASPRTKTILALALALGLIGGLAVAFALERLRPRLYTVEAIEVAADAEVLATIPKVTGEHTRGPLYNSGSSAQEAFGVLAAQILARSPAGKHRSILVTSRKRGDGKSAVSSNLAVELARSGHRVVLIDADMRSPAIDGILRLDVTAGLSTLLESSSVDVALDEVLIKLAQVANLDVMLSGPSPSAPARLLASERMERIIEKLEARYDFVVLDTPPLVVSDPLSIARRVDLVLLVVGGDAVPDREVQAAARQLASIGAAEVSLVVNRWHGRDTTYDYTCRSS